MANITACSYAGGREGRIHGAQEKGSEVNAQSPQVAVKGWRGCTGDRLTLDRSSDRLVAAGGKGKYKLIDAYKQASRLSGSRMRQSFSKCFHSISELRNKIIKKRGI